jgi:hypothetical protein
MTYIYLICKGCDKTTKRFKRRNRKSRFTCKAEQKFCSFMDKFYGNSDLYTVERVIKELTPYLSWLKRYYENVATKIPDKNLACYLSGFDTYGYNNVLNDLDYISDRWRCDWRIRWIINLLDKKYNYSG